MKILASQLSGLVLLLLLFSTRCKAQVELVPVDNNVYPFLETMTMRGIIDFDNSDIPISRRQVALYLVKIDSSEKSLTGTERKILGDLLVEFSYDINKSTAKSFSLFSNLPGGLLNIFDDEKQKYLASYSDTSFSLFLDGLASISYRDFDAESFPKTHLTLGELGARLRGSYRNMLGFYIHVTQGKSLNGDQYARSVASRCDPMLAGSAKFISDRFVDWFDGYGRLQTEDDAVSLTVGRESFEMGNGYIDKLFVSDIIPPFDFVRLDFNYKFFRYAFFYGNLNGDSLGAPLVSKNFVGHRLDIELSPLFRFGFYESVVITNAPFSFTYLNPVSYLTTASYAAEIGNTNNKLDGLDCEIKPLKNIGIQLSWLIDDFNWATLAKHDSTHGDNKFGYQVGLFYSQPFGINDLIAIVEYTRLDPFVYTHQTNKSNYTNWGIGIGTLLPPNSDEIALKLDYYLTNRVTLDFLYKHQRSGVGFLDAKGNQTLNDKGTITRNFGGDVNRGDLDSKYYNGFLEGMRVNHDIFTLSARIEPIRQYFLDITYSFQSIDDIYMSKVFSDQFLYVTGSVDF